MKVKIPTPSAAVQATLAVGVTLDVTVMTAALLDAYTTALAGWIVSNATQARSWYATLSDQLNGKTYTLRYNSSTTLDAAITAARAAGTLPAASASRLVVSTVEVIPDAGFNVNTFD